MANEVTAMDPLGNTVFLLDKICESQPGKEQEVYDDATTVIEKPAILVEVSEKDQKQLYYFRSIGWHHTLLIFVQYANDRWEAYDCIKNPSNEELAAILRKGKQIL